MLMWLRMAPRLHLIFLLMIHWGSSADWAVNYSPSHICALKDSSVIIRCNYKYPTGHQIKSVFWTKGLIKDSEFFDLSEDPEYCQRLQYLGDKQHNCTIRMSHVTKKDEHEYYFRVITNLKDKKWLGRPGVTLNVTDLQVESPERVKEGDSVRLTCKSSCNLTDTTTFIWYKNLQQITGKSNELLLQSVTRQDAGRYRCGVRGHTLTSPEVKLDVMYPPKSISASISGSGEILSGDTVTLNCSSDSNPPAEISWFEGITFVGSGGIILIFKISSDDNGKFKCRARNKHGEKYSDILTLNVKYPPKNVSVFRNGTGEIVSGDLVTLSCSSDSNPPALDFSWFKGETFVESKRIFIIPKISSDDSGQYKCKARNKFGEKYSEILTLNVKYPPKNVSVSINGSGEVVSGDSVSLICISDSNPPALNFSWFEENQSSAVGSGQSFSAVQSGRFYCEARNPHGSQRSGVVTVTVHQRACMDMIVITAASGGLLIIIIIIIIILFIIKKRRSVQFEGLTVTQNALYSDMSRRDLDHDEPHFEPDLDSDTLYANVIHSPPEEIPSATVQYHQGLYENI